MYKRLLSLFLIVCMITAMIVVPVGAETAEDVTSLEEACPCGCGSKLEDVQWRVWDPNTTGTPATGHYYLAGNYVQKEQLEIISGNKILLDLRGYSLTTDDYHRLFLVYGYAAVMDSVGGGRFSAKTTGAGFGGVVMVSTNETNDSVFELYSGTITPDADNKGSRRGGLIHLSATASFRMYGGRLLAGTTFSTADPTKKEPGGCVAGNSADCTIEILGGEIIGGESAAAGGNIYNIGTTVLKNCRILGGTATKAGGNIAQVGGSLTIENCIIENGVSYGTSNGGGNIAITSGGSLSLKDSTLRNGYTDYHGGNIYIGSCSAVIENTQVEAGTAANRGNNIYGATSATSLVIRNCDFPGDVTYVGSGLKLEGLVKIGLLNNGLRLWYADTQAVVDATALTEGSQIYVNANHTFTGAGADLSYFKGALRTVITESAEGLLATQAADGEVGGYCPHCNEQVPWKAFDLEASHVQNCLLDSETDEDPGCTGNHVESGHYYLTQSLSSVAQQYVGAYIKNLGGTLAVEDVVLDLAGYSISATGRGFYLRPADAAGNKNQLTLLDSCGAGKITGSGSNTQGGGVLYNEGSILNIYGGSYIYTPVSGRNITGGGVLMGGNTNNIHGGILDGSAFVYTDASTADKTYSYNGGAVNLGNGVKYFNMTAGVLKGGHAQEGGALYCGYSNQVQITCGQILGDTADNNGGSIRLYGTSSKTDGVLSLSGVALRDGKAAVAGGNLYTQYYTITLDNCYLEDGVADDYGGNINVGTNANITATDTILVGGVAKRSGNIHVAATSAVLNLENTMVLSGTSNSFAGNIHAGNGEITVKGGQILFGSAATYGGNMGCSAGNVTATNFLRIGKDKNGNLPLIAGGTAQTNGGNLYVSGVLYLDAAQLQNGSAANGRDIYLAKQSTQLLLAVGGDVAGEISIYIAPENLGSNIFGEAVAHTQCNTLNARFLLEGNYNNALLCAQNGSLYVGAIAVVDSTGRFHWYTNTTTALEACDENSYIKLYAPAEIALTKDCAIDLNGQNITVSGSYTLYGMDSSGDAFSLPTGKATLSQETQYAQDHRAPGGNRYLALAEENAVSFHRLTLQISQVCVRPGVSGVYYNGVWSCDDALKAQLDSYGVAVSTAAMPTQDLFAEETSLYTTYAADTLVNGQTRPGAIISGILKDGRTPEENDIAGKASILATAYIKLTDGSVFLSDAPGYEDDIHYSLYELMQLLDGLVKSDPIHYRTYNIQLRNFYEAWKTKGMGSWELVNIPKPEDDGVIDILMIGGSFNYYYVEELYAMAEAAGIPMRVCNLYYSGAGPQQHWTWWKNGESPCQFFNTDGNGRVKTDNVGLEWALAQGEWDVLSMQYPSGTVRTDTPQAGFDANKQATDVLAAYLKEQFPDALFCWQQVWAYQVGYDRNGYQVADRTTQLGLYQRHKELAYIAADAYDAYLIPSGDAWELVRQGGYDNLCARLGKGDNHEGDYYHEGDIGGGQYLNACVWFERITGQSCVGNTYVPSYVYGSTTYQINSEITLEALQNAAHQAVANMTNP